MTTLQVEQLSKYYAKDQTAAVEDVSYEVADNEILELVGPSG